ncbi:MAG: alkaline phosphatase family protein [Alphaproteobacteria bacterium]|nr:alkaline phosphatase family protein [Alphaproteobacteria bacterium]
MRRWRACVLAVVAGCAPATVPDGDTDTDSDVAGDARVPRVLVIGVDGLRPDGLAAADTPALDAWFAAGVTTDSGSTQLTGDTVSGPGWASILTGREVEAHGVTSNDDLASISAATPTFLAQARDGGHTAAAAIHWLGVGVLLGSDSTDALVPGDDAAVGAQAARWIADGAFDVVFTHFDDVDHAGHASGFSADNPDYLAAIAAVDTAIGPALDAVAAREGERWLVALVTDHGGLGTGHSGATPPMRTIPLAMTADRGTLTLPATPSQMDVAPTARAWLGLADAATDGTSWWQDAR